MFLYLFVEFCPDYFVGRTGHEGRITNPSSSFGIFSAHKVASKGSFAFELAGSCYFDSFFQTLMGFLFRHITNSFK